MEAGETAEAAGGVAEGILVFGAASEPRGGGSAALRAGARGEQKLQLGEARRSQGSGASCLELLPEHGVCHQREGAAEG